MAWWLGEGKGCEWFKPVVIWVVAHLVEIYKFRDADQVCRLLELKRPRG